MSQAHREEQERAVQFGGHGRAYRNARPCIMAGMSATEDVERQQTNPGRVDGQQSVHGCHVRGLDGHWGDGQQERPEQPHVDAESATAQRIDEPHAHDGCAGRHGPARQARGIRIPDRFGSEGRKAEHPAGGPCRPPVEVHKYRAVAGEQECLSVLLYCRIDGCVEAGRGLFHQVAVRMEAALHKGQRPAVQTKIPQGRHAPVQTIEPKRRGQDQDAGERPLYLDDGRPGTGDGVSCLLLRLLSSSHAGFFC